MNKNIDDYIDNLLRNQNQTSFVEQRDLFKKEDYINLLRDVLDVLHDCKDYSIEEMRGILYDKSGIESRVRDFVFKKGMTPGIVCTIGTSNYEETIIAGNKQEVSLDSEGRLISSVEEMKSDTIFDLASVTKIFTSISILKLAEMNLLSLNDEVVKYAPEFKNLSGVTIYDLLSFNVPLKTERRIDTAISYDEALDVLLNVYVDNDSKRIYAYTDMGAMVLKYVIEHVTGSSYYGFLKSEILSKLGIDDTLVTVPREKMDRVVNTNYDGFLYNDGTFYLNKMVEKGVAYDSKARIMGNRYGNLTGHAGLFSTNDDMVKVAKGLIDGEILGDNFVRELSKNRKGNSYIDENGKKKFVNYLGYLCYSKNPDSSISEVFHALSGRSFSITGWTGTKFTVDPLNKIYLFLGSNRSHNRMTFIDKGQESKVKIDPFGKKTIDLPDGSHMIDSRRFAWDRDKAIVNILMKLALEYKMLEDILGCDKEDCNVKKMEKVIRKK